MERNNQDMTMRLQRRHASYRGSKFMGQERLSLMNFSLFLVSRATNISRCH